MLFKLSTIKTFESHHQPVFAIMPCSAECPGPYCGRCSYRKPSDERIAQHEAEMGRRLKLAIELGVPVHTVVPDDSNGLDDSRLVNGRPVIDRNGDVDPYAVFHMPADTVEDRLHKESRNAEQVWVCACPCGCKQVMRYAPRQFIPSKTRKTEPADWWWCIDCKNRKSCHNMKPSAKRRADDKIARECKKIKNFFA